MQSELNCQQQAHRKKKKKKPNQRTKCSDEQAFPTETKEQFKEAREGYSGRQ